MKDNRVIYCKLEIRKLLQEKLFIVFLAICLCLNICLCLTGSDAREALHQLSTAELSEQGVKIYDELDAAALGRAYYNERYVNSSILNQWMKEKYDRLQGAIDRLDDENADLSFYAGEITAAVHQALFAYQLKALLLECMLLFFLLCLRTFSLERQNETVSLIYSSRRGRRLVRDKILANGVVGFLYCGVLILLSLTVFFCNWDFSGLWNMNVASSFNYVQEADDAFFKKPFITWTSFTVKQYFICSLLLISAIVMVWWLLSNMTALLIGNDLLGGLLLVTILSLPYFGLMIFPELHLPLLFFFSTLTISTVVSDSQRWFTDLGYDTLFAYQEVGIVLVHIVVTAFFIRIGIRSFRRKELA